MHVPRTSGPSGKCQAALFAMAAFALVVGVAPAQLQFDELHKERALPDHRDQTRSVVLGDLDGDGDLDLVVGNVGQHRLYRNDGRNSGIFVDATTGHLPQVGGGSVVMGDVDGDGDRDLVVGDRAQIGLLVNDGSGTFTDVTSARLPGGGGGCVTLGDVDRDGDLDLVIGGVDAQNRLYLNDGTGTFTDVTATRMPVDTDPTFAVVLGDVDGDGDLDMVLGNHGIWIDDPYAGWIFVGVQNRLYLNNGAGTFANATATRMPVDSNITASVALGDVDGDGDLDLVLRDDSRSVLDQTQLYLNDGTGAFTDATRGRLPVVRYASAVALADADGDGDLDILAGVASAGALVGAGTDQNRLLLNDGAGTFADASVARLPSDHDYTVAVAVGDVDGDGDLDLVFGNTSRTAGVGAENRLYVNNGSGAYVDVTAPRMPLDGLDTRAVVLGDVDGDGDLDMVQGNYSISGSCNRLLLNDGDGAYTDVTVVRGAVGQDGSTRSLALADVDADGDLDLVFGNQRPNELFLNDGRGFYRASSGLPVDFAPTYGVALGDIDGDGDLDLVCANGDPVASSYYQSRLYLNDGTGVFRDVTARLPKAPAFSKAVALGDVDGDGDLDLVFGDCPDFLGVGGQNRLFVNDGTGTFTDVTVSRLPQGDDYTEAVVFGDVDGDGDLDLVIANSRLQNRLLLNDGSGTFTEASAGRLPLDVSGNAALGDLDDDGDLDLVLGGSLYLNDGRGAFTRVSIGLSLGLTQNVVLGDVDGDGDLDLAFAVRGQDRVLQNLLRQIRSPFLLRSGRALTLEGYARGGPPRVVDVVLPVASTGRARLPLPPFGTVGIDPAQSFALPPFVIPQPAGVGSVSIALPNAPSLVGVPVYCQALMLPFPLQGRLTNVTIDVIVR